MATKAELEHDLVEAISANNNLRNDNYRLNTELKTITNESKTNQIKLEAANIQLNKIEQSVHAIGAVVFPGQSIACPECPSIGEVLERDDFLSALIYVYDLTQHTRGGNPSFHPIFGYDQR